MSFRVLCVLGYAMPRLAALYRRASLCGLVKPQFEPIVNRGNGVRCVCSWMVVTRGSGIMHLVAACPRMMVCDKPWVRVLGAIE